MPSYPWMQENLVDMDTMSVKLKAMKALGVPYTDGDIANVEDSYLTQARKVQSKLKESGVEINERSEMVSIIAYMQRLGVDIKNADPEELKKN